MLCSIRRGNLFGYVQGDFRTPDNLNEIFETFPPIFKNTLVSCSDIGWFMEKFAQANNLLNQHRRKIIPSFYLANGTIITPFWNFQLDLGVECIYLQNRGKRVNYPHFLLFLKMWSHIYRHFTGLVVDKITDLRVQETMSSKILQHKNQLKTIFFLKQITLFRKKVIFTCFLLYFFRRHFRYIPIGIFIPIVSHHSSRSEDFPKISLANSI